MAGSDPNDLTARILRAAREEGRVVSPDAVDRGYWQGWSPVYARPAKPPIDRPINILPTAEREPTGDDPQYPIWLNTNCPPWVCPPWWSVPVELTFEKCIPYYEQALPMGCIHVPVDYMLIVRNISYEVFNAEIYDAFQFDFLIDSANAISIEDMLIDPTSPNPAHRYALAGHTRPMQTHFIVDRNHTLCVRGLLKGQIDFNGNSPHAPGDPITTGNCIMKVLVQGWLAEMREDVDGSPRPTDLGDLDNVSLENDQEYGGYP